MAFEESKESPTGPDDGPLGLPVHFDRLKHNRCPRCGDDLEEFTHVGRLACYVCGFKINTAVANRLGKILKFGETVATSGRGYFIGLTNFKDETPF